MPSKLVPRGEAVNLEAKDPPHHFTGREFLLLGHNDARVVATRFYELAVKPTEIGGVRLFAVVFIERTLLCREEKPRRKILSGFRDQFEAQVAAHDAMSRSWLLNSQLAGWERVT